MSNRSQNFKNKNKFNKNLKKESTINPNLKNYNITGCNVSKNFINEYSVLANIVCSIIGLKKEDLSSFINNEYKGIHNSLIKDKYVILEKDAYEKMQKSLSEAFKAGENNEYEKHLKEVKEAFKNGVKYASDLNRINDSNFLKDQFILDILKRFF